MIVDFFYPYFTPTLIGAMYLLWVCSDLGSTIFVLIFFSRLTLNANEDYSSSDDGEDFTSRLDLSFESDNDSVDSIPSDTKCAKKLSELKI